MAVRVQVAKWGNGLGVRVPREVAAEAGITAGVRVDVEASPDGRIIISRARRRFTLAELVAGMTPGHEHPLEDDGPIGEEII